MRKILAALLLFGCAAVEIVLFRGDQLYERARKNPAVPQARIAILEKEQMFYPVHDGLYHELGKAYFELGLENLQNVERRDEAFRNSYRQYILALDINPFSASTHFDFAQALLYMNYLSLPVARIPYFDEFKHAAVLAKYNMDVYYEVGRVMLSRWPALTADERQFAVEIMQRTLQQINPTRLMEVFNLWALNVKDYDFIEKILPRDRTAFRMFAQFLGERSLDREERLKFLSLTESLDFAEAKNEYEAGREATRMFKLRQAEDHFQATLGLLQNIKFYQALKLQSLIDPMEFQNLQKMSYLGLAKCLIEDTRRLDKAMPYLRSYLMFEDKSAGVAELESFLRERGLIQEKSGLGFKDFGQFSFAIWLSYKQNRYRDIVDVGNSLDQSFLVIPETMRNEYIKIIELVGDSYQKLDYIYESNNFYQKARTMGAQDLGILLKIRKNYERLNDAEQIQAMNEEIRKILAPPELTYTNLTIRRGEAYSQELMLDGRQTTVSLVFGSNPQEPLPLVSIFFNGQVVWEDYLKEPVLSLRLNPFPGVNVCQIVPVNKDVVLSKLALAAEQADKTGEKTEILKK